MSFAFPMQHFYRRPAAAFTLIELVIVIAIIAILALMALPSLYGQTARKQVAEAMPLMDIALKAVRFFPGASKGELPTDNEAAKLPAPEKLAGNYVSAVTVKDGAVTITFGNNVTSRLKGKKLTKRPFISPEAAIVPVDFVCAKRKVPDKMQVFGIDETNIDVEALPLDCR